MRHLQQAITRTTFTALTALALAACSGSSGYGGGPTGTTGGNNNSGGSTSNAIAVADNSFTPNATTVPRGTTVTWTWGGRVQHNVTFDDGPASATQSSGTYT